MRKKGLLLILLAGVFLTLSGCMIKTVDELYAVPRVSEEYQNLQDTINGVVGSGDAISPLSGNNTQTIQLVDLDKDGEDEAIAFYRDSTAERPLKIAFFKKLGEDYVLYATIEGAASDIESIEYVDLFGDDKMEILVSWQVTPTIHTLIAYSIFDDQVVELMRSSYTRYVNMDMNMDGKLDLLLIQTDSSAPSFNRVELYMGTENSMELHSSANLSEGITGSGPTLETGYLVGDVPALFVSYEHGDNHYITDVFALTEDGLRNVTYNEEERKSVETLRVTTGVIPRDINRDGITEIPSPQSFSGSDVVITGSDSFLKLVWKQYDVNGVGYPVMSTYQNSSDGWYVELPEAWDGLVTVARPETKNIEERAVAFYYWGEGGEEEPVPFLVVYRLYGNNRYIYARQAGRTILMDDNETIYAVEFLEIGWDCGLDADTFSERFNLI